MTQARLNTIFNAVRTWDDPPIRTYRIIGREYSGALDEVGRYGAAHGINRVREKLLVVPGVIELELELGSVSWPVTAGPLAVIAAVLIGYDEAADLGAIDEAVRAALQDYTDLIRLPLWSPDLESLAPGMRATQNIAESDPILGVSAPSAKPRNAALSSQKYDPKVDPDVDHLQTLVRRVNNFAYLDQAAKRALQQEVDAEVYRLWKAGYYLHQLDKVLGHSQASYRTIRHRRRIGEVIPGHGYGRHYHK